MADQHTRPLFYLRKYDLVERSDKQDGWVLEIRKRMSGKLKGSTYKVFIAPDGGKHYSAPAAEKAGFKRTKSCDGRKKTKKQTLKGK